MDAPIVDYAPLLQQVMGIQNQGSLPICTVYACLNNITAIRTIGDKRVHPLLSVKEVSCCSRQRLVEYQSVSGYPKGETWIDHLCFPTFSLHEVFRYVQVCGVTLRECYDFPCGRLPSHILDDAPVGTPRVSIQSFELLPKVGPADKEAWVLQYLDRHPIVGVLCSFKSFEAVRNYEIYAGPTEAEIHRVEKFGYSSIITHAVLVVGYGRGDGGRTYLIIMNTWGSVWGCNGIGRVYLDLFLDFGTPVAPYDMQRA